MDDWFKAIIGIVVAVAFIGVIMGITTPTYTTSSADQRLVTCTLNTWCYTTYDNLQSLVVGNGTGSKVLATVAASGATEDYIPDLTNGRINITNMTGTGTFNLSYAYYPDEYDTGASGSTTRVVAQLLPLAFIILVLVLIFGWAMQQKVE